MHTGDIQAERNGTRHRDTARCRVPCFGVGARLLLILFVVLSFVLTPSAFARVVITEIQYDPPGPDGGNEWIEIMNDGGSAVTITDYRFWEAETGHKIKESSGGSVLAPNGVAVITSKDVTKFKNTYPKYTGMLLTSSFSLRQMQGLGEELGIKNDTGEFDFRYTYTPDDKAKGTGATLHLTPTGGQVAAPATPGAVAVNPITVSNREPGAKKEAVEEVIEEEVPLEELVEEALNTENDTETGAVESHTVAEGTNGLGGGWQGPFGGNGMFPYPYYQNSGQFGMPPGYMGAFGYPFPVPYQASQKTQPIVLPPAQIVPQAMPNYASPLLWIAVMLSIIAIELFVFLVLFRFAFFAPGERTVRRKRGTNRIAGGMKGVRSIAAMKIKKRKGK